MNNYCTIYLVRHGQTEWNTKGILQGQKDSKLTPKGIAKAEKLAEELKPIKFDAIYSSDLARTTRTAKILKLERDLTILTRKRLRERNFGALEGQHYTTEDARKYMEMKQKLSQIGYQKVYSSKVMDDVESDKEITTRFITVMREISIAHPKQTVLVVSHGGIMRQFLIRLGFADYKELTPGSITNLGYAKLRSDGVDFFVDETSGITLKSD